MADRSNMFSALLDLKVEALLLDSRRSNKPSAWHGHVAFAHWIVAATAPRSVVELGTHHGVSFAAFCHAVASFGMAVKCHAVDTWRGDEHAGYYGDEIHDELKAYIEPYYGSFATMLRMTFDDALPTFPDGSIDVLHIDGLHTYEACRHDFEGWLPKMSDRGVVMLHDTEVTEPGFGVVTLWHELRKRYPSFSFTHSFGLGVLAVGSRVPPGIGALCSLRGDEAVRVGRLFERCSSAARFSEERWQRLGDDLAAVRASMY